MSEHDFRFTRRQALVGAAKFSAGTAALATIGAGPRPSQSSRPPEATIGDVFGMHGNSNSGGGMYPERTISYLEGLHAKTLVAINPSEELLAECQEAGIEVISRLRHEDNGIANNRYRPKFFEEQVRLGRSYGVNYFQPYNEVNLLAETAGKHITPQEHALDLVLAMELIDHFRGITIFTPFAQNSHPFENEKYWFKHTLSEVEKQKGPGYLSSRMVIGAHPYNLFLGDDPIQKIEEMDEIAEQILNYHPAFIGLEGGLYQNRESSLDPGIVTKETLRIHDAPTKRLKILSFHLWLLSSFAQRPSDHQSLDGGRTEELHDFEPSAWIGVDAEGNVYPKPVYLEIAHRRLDFAA